MSRKAPVKVVIVDDSALVRTMLSDIFNSDPRLKVVGVAADPLEARDVIKQTSPDVLTLDIEMPKMNGIAFLKNLMKLRPMPVVMVSTLTQAGAPITLEALEIGAVDFLPKPKTTGDVGLINYKDQIIEKVVLAARANLSHFEKSKQATTSLVSPKLNGKALKKDMMCFIGASTGGTEAIKAVLSRLPTDIPPILVTQHIPASFSTSFANRLDACSQVKVQEATHNMPINPGNVYLAPGDDHLRIKKSSYGYICHLEKSDLVNRHRPSVEVLFHSAIEVMGSNCMGILLTGMGADGSQALADMRNAGCYTIAQDEKSSVVWGMPGVAVRLGGADQVLSLDKVPGAILNHCFQ